MDCELENGRRRNILESAMGEWLAIRPYFLLGCLWTFRMVQEGRWRMGDTETWPYKTTSSAQFRADNSRLHRHDILYLKSNRHHICTIASLPVLLLVCAAASFPGLEDTIPHSCQNCSHWWNRILVECFPLHGCFLYGSPSSKHPPARGNMDRLS